LDDAFQHRRVRASTTILLTSFDALFLDDYLLPAGNLREPRSGAKRADIIVVTKCPDGVAYAKLQEIQFRMQLLPHQRIYFSRIGYEAQIYGKSETLPLDYLLDKKFTLVTGIANPKPLLDYLKRRAFTFTHKKFQDHHMFSDREIKTLQQEDVLLTTEKDYMRLEPRLGKFALYYLPIKTLILNDQEDYFKQAIITSIEEQRDA
jgi:tetraacyldisaccharide 4'-kinase